MTQQNPSSDPSKPTSSGGGPHDTPTVAPAQASTNIAQMFERRLPPERIGPYRILHQIGRGGMGLVYLAQRDDDQFHKRVALKVVKRGMDTDDILRRFELERQLLAAMNHPNIARLIDGGATDDGRPYFVMEYVEGMPIDRYCDVNRLPIIDRLNLFKQVCSAVHYAHQNLVVHRDLKPGNILVTRDGVPKLLDFGIAKLLNPDIMVFEHDPTGTAIRLMTPEYASPEQVRGEPLSTVSDVYSLGVLLYELLTGHPPYRLKSRIQQEIERVVCEEEPERPSTAISKVEEVQVEDATAPGKVTTHTITAEEVSRFRESRPQKLKKRLSGDLDNIVMMAMRKEARRRYTSAEQLAEDINRHLQGLPVIARKPTAGYRFAKFVHRNRGAVAAVAAIIITLAGGMAATYAGYTEAQRQKGVAQEQALIAATERDRVSNLLADVTGVSETCAGEFEKALKTQAANIAAREAILNVAGKYFDLLLANLSGDQELDRLRATLLYQRGRLQGGKRADNAGDMKGALESQTKAAEILRRLHAATPADWSVRSALILCLLEIGDLRSRDKTYQSEDVLRMYTDAEALLKGVEPRDAASQQYLSCQAAVTLSIADVLAQLNRIDEANKYLAQSMELRQQLRGEAPDDPRQLRKLIAGRNRLAFAEVQKGNYKDALSQFETSLELCRQCVDADPPNTRYQRDLAYQHMWCGDALYRLKRYDEAAAHLNKALTQSETLLKNEPESARRRHDVAVFKRWAGAILDAQGRHKDAQKSYESAIALLSQSPSDANNVFALKELGRTKRDLSYSLQQTKDLGQAERLARESLEIFQQLAANDQQNVELQNERKASEARLNSMISEKPDSGDEQAPANAEQSGDDAPAAEPTS